MEETGAEIVAPQTPSQALPKGVHPFPPDANGHDASGLS
jgi:hypothetical protein